MTVFAPALGILLVLGALGALFGGLRVLRARTTIHPEFLRKGLHVGMGLVCMTFPWLFHSAWPVAILAVLAGVALIAMRSLPRLRSSFGQVLHGVQRTSLGEFYFIAGVLGLFLMAGGQPLLYALCLVWLTFADATAAIVGLRYGTVTYATRDGRKSLEGSLAFFAITYVTTFMGLVAMGHVDVLADALIGATMALAVMLLEAVAWGGLDNLVIPIFGCALFGMLVDEHVPALAGRAAVLGGLFLLTHWQRRRTTLSEDALLGGILCGYAFWVLGGWPWLLAPLVLFLKDKRQSAAVGEGKHTIHAILATCAGGLACVLFNRIFPTIDWLLISTLGFAVHFAIYEMTRTTRRAPALTPSAVVLKATGLAALLIVGPFVAVRGAGPAVLVEAAGCVALILLLTELFRRLQPEIADCPLDGARWIRQTGLATLGSAGGAVLLAALR
jgi:phytol kinase